MTKTSPGFERMKKRLGPDAAEQLRLDTLKLQEAALDGARPKTTAKSEKPETKIVRDTIKGKR
jgi:hypothetical protein